MPQPPNEQINPAPAHGEAPPWSDPEATWSAQSSVVSSPTPPRRRRVWLIVLILVLAVVTAAVGAILYYYYVVAHRGTEYCQTYIELSEVTPQLAMRLSNAATDGDFPEVISVLGEMGDSFDQLKAANPPDEAGPALDTMITYLDGLKSTAESEGAEGYLNYISASDVDFQQTADLVDTVSVEYCS